MEWAQYSEDLTPANDGRQSSAHIQASRSGAWISDAILEISGALINYRSRDAHSESEIVDNAKDFAQVYVSALPRTSNTSTRSEKLSSKVPCSHGCRCGSRCQAAVSHQRTTLRPERIASPPIGNHYCKIDQFVYGRASVGSAKACPSLGNRRRLTKGYSYRLVDATSGEKARTPAEMLASLLLMYAITLDSIRAEKTIDSAQSKNKGRISKLLNVKGTFSIH